MITTTTIKTMSNNKRKENKHSKEDHKKRKFDVLSDKAITECQNVHAFNFKSITFFGGFHGFSFFLLDDSLHFPKKSKSIDTSNSKESSSSKKSNKQMFDIVDYMIKKIYF